MDDFEARLVAIERYLEDLLRIQEDLLRRLAAAEQKLAARGT